MPYDPERHHRRSVRLDRHDYASGTYFITLCAHQRTCLFGHVVDDEVLLSPFGKIVAEEWLCSAEIRPEIVLVDVVVMPNHLHGLVTILDPTGLPLNADVHPVGAHGRAPVSTHTSLLPITPSQRTTSASGTALHRRPRSLGSFVAGFKSSSTTRLNALRGTTGAPVWQRGYHDHLIRTDDAFDRIRAYIAANPARWHQDEENPAHRR
ncbi:MAG: transposase [Chloroflexota bacterium]|nr:transposase [Chloroflexota bacterium]